MPLYPIEPAVLAAAKRALAAHQNSFACAAKELGQDRVFFWRFLKSGRAKPTNLDRLKRELTRRGYLNDQELIRSAGRVEVVTDVHPIAKQVIQYLLSAVEERERPEGGLGGSGA